jgi:uncharacterized protein DUF222
VVEPSLFDSVDVVYAALVSFQPGAYSGDDCAALVEKLAALEKVSGVARVGAAARAGECGEHRERGFAKVADWVARITGTTPGAANADLDTLAALESQPDVLAALEAGELSFAQARELVRTETAVPGSTAGLLDVAKTESFRTLKDKARDRRVRAIDPDELHARQHAAMSHRTWINALGNVAYAGELPPELGIPFQSILDAETDRLWLQAHHDAKRHDGATELRRSALAAQAFARLIEQGGGNGKTGRADIVIVCDLQAWRRGHAHDGEPCHIIGGGPIPVSLAKELGRDAFLKAVLHTGTELHTIAHFGRRYPAVLRTALELGAPPDFNGTVCAAPGCDRRYHRRIPSVVATPEPLRSCVASSSSTPEGWRESTAEGKEGSIPAAHVGRNDELGCVSDRGSGPKDRQLLAVWPEAGGPSRPGGVLPTGGRSASSDRSPVRVLGGTAGYR